MNRSLFAWCVLASVILFKTGSLNAAERGLDGRLGASSSGTTPSPSIRSLPETPITTGIILREGTRVGPVSGRFVMSGQRWRFLPETPPPRETSELLDQGQFRKPTADGQSLLGRSDSVTTETTIRNPSKRHSEGFGVGKPRGKSAAQQVVQLPISLVVENLMLDRISRAIEGDPNDDRWTITGHVTEFRDENRLMIQTAVRAPIADLAR